MSLLLSDVSLKDYTSWRVGGKAEYFFAPKSLEALQLFFAQEYKNQALLWLGLGSNLLIRDGGIDGVVIFTQAHLHALSLQEPKIIRAEAGVACGQLARFSARQNLTGIEFLAGVPGTVGGALAMNAGCFGGQTWEHVCAVETIDEKGEFHLRKPEDFYIAYREVKPKQPKEWFVAALFELQTGDKQKSLDKIRQFLDTRASTQPTNIPSCGSVFRNPPGDYAARLIESAGLKGYRLGGAQVSEKHANFILNEGQATAADIENLIQLVSDSVFEKHAIRLHKEVHIIGNPL